MKNTIQRFVYSIIDIFNFNKPLNQHSNLIVLAYHTVTDVKKFEEQLYFLKNNYNVIGISALEDHLFKGVKLKPKSLLITFDDGDVSALDSGCYCSKNIIFRLSCS